MSKNYMAGVAELLGIEIGQSFKIVDDTYGIRQSYYRLTEENGCEISDDNTSWVTVSAEVLKWLIMGDVRISKLPWKPTNEGEWYYTPALDTESGCYTVYWENDDTDKRRYRRGLIFKTREEAIAVSKKMLDILEEVRGNE